MSDMAKQARAAMKAKAKSLTTADPHQKVDSSTWTPAEPLNADIKTGLRPLSRRAFKAGGKVQGAKAKANLGKATRSGNKPITPDNFANKDVKAANQDRPGIKHVGGMKKGGRTCAYTGGDMELAAKEYGERTKMTPEERANLANPERAPVTDAQARRMRELSRKSGGRTKKAEGGPMESPLAMYGKGVSGANAMMQAAKARAGVPGGLYGSTFSRVQKGSLSPARAAGIMKRGGAAEKHSDEKMDIALIKKMVKPEARTARKTGGRTKPKGKTNINIVIAAGKPAGQGDMMAPGMGGPTLPPGMGGAPGGLPIPVPAAGGPQGAPQGGAPAPMPMPMPMPPAGGAGPMPTPRKDGGRLTRRASSYKDMEAGAGSGEGRLQKTDIAKRIPKPTENGVIGTTNLGYPNKVPGATGGRTAKKAGGRTYRSYKDMDAGAGSGMGRLEKSEIQAHKG